MTERNGYIREASSIRFNRINRSFRRARSLDRDVGNEVHRSGQRTSSYDNATMRHCVIEYVCAIYLYVPSNSRPSINLRFAINFRRVSTSRSVHFNSKDDSKIIFKEGGHPEKRVKGRVGRGGDEKRCSNRFINSTARIGSQLGLRKSYSIRII